MSTEVRFRGGTTAQYQSFVGASREVTVDTTKNTLVVQDGVTPGGNPLATEKALNEHKAEKVAFAGSFSRDASIAGVQNIRGLGFMPKSVLFIATVNGQQNKHAFGFIAENGQQRTLLTIQSGAKYVESGRVMNLMDDSSNNTIGIASLVEDGFDITWEHRGAGATGTISVMYLAHSHGGGAS